MQSFHVVRQGDLADIRTCIRAVHPLILSLASMSAPPLSTKIFAIPSLPAIAANMRAVAPTPSVASTSAPSPNISTTAAPSPSRTAPRNKSTSLAPPSPLELDRLASVLSSR